MCSMTLHSSGFVLRASWSITANPHFFKLKPFKPHKLNPLRASGEDNGSIEEPKKPGRRGLKKTPTSASTSPPKKTQRSKKAQVENGPVELEPKSSDSELEDYDEDIDFPYDYLPLVCCFGAAQKEFVPTVRVSDNPMDPDMYNQWKMLQWHWETGDLISRRPESSVSDNEREISRRDLIRRRPGSSVSDSEREAVAV